MNLESQSAVIMLQPLLYESADMLFWIIFSICWAELDSYVLVFPIPIERYFSVEHATFT